MPQFEVGQSKTARVRMKNPTTKAFDYTGFILFSLSPVSEKSFSLATGEEKDVLFPVTIPDAVGTHPVHVIVKANGETIKTYQAEDVTISPPSLGLSFTNPRSAGGAVVWDAWIWDIVAKTRISSTPSGIKELGVPCTFYPIANTFLLYVMEQPPYPLPGPYWYGPYLVSVPELGAYTWDSKAGKIDGVQAVDLPLSASSPEKCKGCPGPAKQRRVFGPPPSSFWKRPASPGTKTWDSILLGQAS